MPKLRPVPYRYERRNANRGARAKALKAWRLQNGLSKADAAFYHHTACAAKKAGVSPEEWHCSHGGRIIEGLLVKAKKPLAKAKKLAYKASGVRSR